MKGMGKRYLILEFDSDEERDEVLMNRIDTDTPAYFIEQAEATGTGKWRSVQ
jgi:hypothetical protein